MCVSAYIYRHTYTNFGVGVGGDHPSIVTTVNSLVYNTHFSTLWKNLTFVRLLFTEIVLYMAKSQTRLSDSGHGHAATTD